MKITNHLGVYGINIDKDKLLCIQKNAGPYKGRFDLPGGSQNIGEGLTETLRREVLEETGFTLSHYSNPRMYDAFVKEKDSDSMVHHIMMFYDYDIDFSVPKKKLPTLVEEGRNDSDYDMWVKLEDITIDNSSPLVLKVKQEWLRQINLDKEMYVNWQVIDSN